MYCVIPVISWSYLVLCTIDTTLPEFQYIANHLTKEECHKLIALLYVNSFDINRSVENVENAVPEDIGCLKLLLHWNLSPNEGRGATHEKISLRLRQMGKKPLADWLDKAVFKELEEEIIKDTEDFQSSSKDNKSTENFEEDLEDEFIVDFTLMDILLYTAGAVSILLVCFVVMLLGYLIHRQRKEGELDFRNIVRERHNERMRDYQLLENYRQLQS